MTLDEIRELGKKEIGYNRLVNFFSKKDADDRLWFWMEGFSKAEQILRAEQHPP